MKDAGAPAPAVSGLAWPDATGKAVADHFGFTPEWLHKLELRGFLERKGNGLFDLGQAARGIVAFYKSPDRRAAREALSAPLREMKRRRIKATDAMAAAKLHEADLLESEVTRTMALLRSVLLQLRPFDDPAVEADVRERIVEAVETTQRAVDAFFDSFRAQATDPQAGTAGDVLAENEA